MPKEMHFFDFYAFGDWNFNLIFCFWVLIERFGRRQEGLDWMF
jgi:hypothetical protein